MSSYIRTQYYPVKKVCGDNTTDIKVTLHYELGGYSYFTNKDIQRGYYLSVQPVEKAGHMEGFIAFSGCKICIKPVKRASKKAEESAIKIFDDACRTKSFMNYVRDYELKED